jgi:hypothetical protein
MGVGQRILVVADVRVRALDRSLQSSERLYAVRRNRVDWRTVYRREHQRRLEVERFGLHVDARGIVRAVVCSVSLWSERGRRFDRHHERINSSARK